MSLERGQSGAVTVCAGSLANFRNPHKWAGKKLRIVGWSTEEYRVLVDTGKLIASVHPDCVELLTDERN